MLFAIFFKFSKTYVQAFKKIKSDKIKEFAANVCFLFTTFFFQKRRENSNRIKFEYDGLSEVMLSLSHSRSGLADVIGFLVVWSVCRL